MRRAAIILAAVGGCGHKNDASNWIDKPWTAVHAELDGVGFAAEVPDKLPACVVPGCWTNDPKPENDIYMPGPTFRVELKQRSFATAAAYEEYVARDTCHEAKVEAQNAGFHAACRGEHGEPGVRVWIPLDDKRGLECTATWWAGPNKHGDRADPPPASWLEKFCASVRVEKH